MFSLKTMARPLAMLALVLGAGAQSQAQARMQAQTPAPAPAGVNPNALRDKFLDPARGVFVVAHRGCHNPAPARQLPSAPENSLLAMDHCVALGVDMMELDVRRTSDGALVILHDARIDRTTNGRGRLAELTLAEVKRLRLRDNLGGNVYPGVSDQVMPTLDEALQHAKGRIMLNLDIKEEIYPEVVAAALAAGMGDQVVIKRVVSRDVGPLVDQAPYDQVPFMPILGNWPSEPATADLGDIAARQLQGKNRPAGVELVFLSQQQFAAVRRVARERKIRLWANTLGDVIGVIGAGSDLDAMRTQGKTWGAMMDQGIDTFQTDEPGPLIEYLRSRTAP
jgi:glycerophosphoryl diester phosphodiesterase